MKMVGQDSEPFNHLYVGNFGSGPTVFRDVAAPSVARPFPLLKRLGLSHLDVVDVIAPCCAILLETSL